MNKKLLKSLFAVVLAMVGIFAVSQSANATVNGDADGDGVVTSSDVTALYNYLLNGDVVLNGDVNGDGSITSADITYVYNIMLGTLPVENEKVYILGQANGNTWGAATGVEMEYYEWEGVKEYSAFVEFAGENDGYSYFSFTKKLAENNNDWDAIADQRFGSESDGFLIIGEQFETPLPLTYENPQAFKIAAGKYILVVNLEAMTLTVTPTMPPIPANVYILGEVNGNQWNPAVGVEMTSEDGNIFTAQITTKETGFSYFSFTRMLADAESETGWDDIAPYRFGAVSAGDPNFIVTEDLLGTEIALTTENYLALQMAPGTFTLSLDLENMKLTINGEFTPQPQPEDNWYLIGTNNGWSTSDMSYKFTQSAENANVYSIHVDNVSGDFWFKIANEDCYTAADFWNGGTMLSFATNGESALTGNLVEGNQGAFCLPASYHATYFDLTIDVENLTYTITTDGQEPVIDPTAEYDYVYVTGTADNWSGNGSKLASVKNANNYYGFFYATGEFKIKKDPDSWATNWGGTNGNLVADGANILANGLVYVNANLNNMTYSVTEITSMGIIGDAVNADWATEAPLTYNAETGAWEATGVVLNAGSVKFRANNSWDINFGGALDNLVINGENITVEAGTYNVVLTLVCPGEYTATITPAN